jgi:hypothetical protein
MSSFEWSVTIPLTVLAWLAWDILRTLHKIHETLLDRLPDPIDEDDFPPAP